MMLHHGVQRMKSVCELIEIVIKHTQKFYLQLLHKASYNAGTSFSHLQ